MMMFRRILLSVSLVAAALAVPTAGCAGAAGSSPSVRALPPEAPEPALPIPEMILAGDPIAIGTAHGRQFGDSIHVLEENYLNVRLADSRRRMMALEAAAIFETLLPPDYREEIHALADAAKLDRRTAMLAQCFLDLTDTVACSTVSLPASAAPDGIARMGRNLDFPSLQIADKMSALLIYRPTGRYQFAAIGWPGLIGVISGMNEHGLVLANMEVNRAPRFPTAMPYALLYRRVLEQCRSVDEAIALLRITPRQSANNLMLMDAAGDRAVVEISPEKIELRRADPHEPLVSTNHQRGQDAQSPGRCWRYDLLRDQSLARFGQIKPSDLEAMLSNAQQGTFTIQSMVFEPSTRVIYLACGAQAGSRTFYRIDLKRRFR